MLNRLAWDVHPPDPDGARRLAQQCGTHPVIGQVLLNRGVRHPDEARRFLSPGLEALDDPLQLPQMEQAVGRIHRALAGREPILVFGDSDVDGVTASAIVSEWLTGRGARVSVRLSNRLKDGYGVPPSLVARLVRAGIKLLILVDCGTNQAEEVQQLARQGIDTIILDHHVPTDHAARPYALVNPHRGQGIGRPQTASFGTPVAHPADGWVPGLGRELCSAGLAMKLVQASLRLTAHRPEGDRLAPYLDLAALGTLADCAPLVGDNRILVTGGTEQLRGARRTGLAVLCESLGLSDSTAEQILQRVVPVLNAPGRLGNPAPVWRLLVERSVPRARRLAALLKDAHETTKTLHRQILSEAHEQANRIHFKDHWVMVLGRRGWHPGLMGVVAAQLSERYARPAIAIAFAEGIGVGSGRSPSVFNLLEALRACEGMLLRYGGHPQACGLTINAAALESFRESINRHAKGSCDPASFAQTLKVDAELTVRDLTVRVAAALQALKPFGRGNPSPLLIIRRLQLDADPSGNRWVTDGAARMRVKGRPVSQLAPQGRYDVVGCPSLTKEEVVLSVRDARASTALS